MKKTVIYTDGACSGNPGPGGWGFAWIDKENDEIKYSDAGKDSETTNNKMELTACIKALEYIKKEEIEKEVAIYTDSSYVLNSMTSWAHGWKKNGWKKSKGKAIENPELIKRLYELCHEDELRVSFVKVKAHQKKGSTFYDKYNDYVDKLATGEVKL